MRFDGNEIGDIMSEIACTALPCRSRRATEPDGCLTSKRLIPDSRLQRQDRCAGHGYSVAIPHAEMGLTATMDVRWGALSDTGRMRAGNEDALVADGRLFAVADGMGGHRAGEVASRLAVEELARLSSDAQGSEPLTVEAVTEAIRRAGDVIQAAANDPAEDRYGMGTTLVGLAQVRDGQSDLWLIFNIGDSRLYRWADRELTQVTVDHSEISELVESGALTTDQARNHPHRNVITRALGSDPVPPADLWLVPPTAGERYLICSDGLTNELDDVRLAELLGEGFDPQTTAQELVDAALQSGGRDNVSVIVVDVDLDTSAAEATTAPADETTVPRLPIEDNSTLISDVPL